MSKTKRPDNGIAQIAAWHDYQVFEQFEAGMVLQGWEASIRAGRAQIKKVTSLFAKVSMVTQRPY